MTITIDRTRLDEFTRAYIRAALWSSTDESDDRGGEPMDANYDLRDIEEETLATMVADCQAFQEANADDLARAARMLAEGSWHLPTGAHCTVPQYAGHDFWLTRNGHGCGFFDGDWPEGIADRLDQAADTFGPFDLYIGDDGRIHGQ